MKNHTNAALLAAATLSTLGLLATPADAEVLVAGWDTFTGSPASNSPATQTDGVTGASMTGTADSGNWGDWNGGGTEDGASPDGTFGNLDMGIAAASTFIGTGSGQDTNLSLGRNNKPGTLVISLVNNSGADRDFEAFYFDGARRFAQSATDWELSFSNAIGGTSVTGNFVRNDDGMSGIAAGDRDFKIDLTGLTDAVWEAGSTATFTLVVSGGTASSSPSSNGGHETLIDNIGVTASVIPEPSSLALLGMGALAMFRRRRSA